jgi:hypothetical protein
MVRRAYIDLDHPLKILDLPVLERGFSHLP